MVEIDRQAGRIGAANGWRRIIGAFAVVWLAVVAESAGAAPVLEYSVVAEDGTDSVSAVAATRDGSLWITGVTTNAELPLSDNAVDRTFAAFEEGYVIKLDPQGQVAYSSYLGGNALDYPGDIAVDDDGNVYIAGATYSTDFPRSQDARQPQVGFPGLATLFVTKLDSSGNLVYSSYFGGTGGEGAYTSGRGVPAAGVAVGKDGSVFVSSATLSMDFPASLGAYQRTFGGRQDAVLIKFEPNFAVSYATYFGGPNGEVAYRVGTDADGDAVILGIATRFFGEMWNFPATPGAFQVDSTDDSPFFVAKFDSVGDLAYATFLGPTMGVDGFPANYRGDLGVDPSGNAYVVGAATSNFFPTTPGAYQSMPRGFSDLFLSKLDPTGSHLVFSTYFGGTSNELSSGGAGVQVAVDDQGRSYVGGSTSSADLPLLDPFETRFGLGQFVASFNADGSLAYSSYVEIGPAALSVRRGALYVGGQLASTQLTVGATKIVETLCTDCDADGMTRANDIVAAVLIGIGESTLETCDLADANEDGMVVDDEVSRVARLVFESCRA